MQPFKYTLWIVLLIKFDVITSLHVKAHFTPSDGSSFPRIRMAELLTNLEELTFCSWIKPYFLSDLNCLLSYATVSNDNQLIISLITKENNTKIEVNYAGSILQVPCSHITWKNGEWYHLCLNLFCVNGAIAFYVNGIHCAECKSHADFAKKLIPSGGQLVIGQEQDGVDSKYDPNQGWYGDIADVHIWNERLTHKQIQEAGRCNGGRKEGNVFAWMKTKIFATDNVLFSETEVCNP
ncbi:C-reactive protein 1.4-like [Centruroides sculpturatus]|uniref:C-reactive protein 1.4-like n=1 Tax=Centruroides sculpturatus TaxID=218467 RepID=UPI000C6DE829|nr:C-reactive protein 1.4-like [Centruroides sculpturatus]